MSHALLTVSGNVAAPPVVRRLPGGERVASFRIAHTPSRLDRSTGVWHDLPTLWFRVSAWRTLADNCAQSLGKGDRVVVSGRLTMSTWTNDQGEERMGYEIDARSIGLDLSRSPATTVRAAVVDASTDPGDPPEDACPAGLDDEPGQEGEEVPDALRGALAGAGV